MAQPDELRAIVHDWHPGIGSALLQSLDLPESVSRACDEHELPPSVLPAILLTRALLVTETVPLELAIPPPEWATLPSSVTLVSCTVPPLLKVLKNWVPVSGSSARRSPLPLNEK